MTTPKEKDYLKYGWKCNENNLKTLPPEAPEAAKNLTKWLTLEGRKRSLEEWLGFVGEDDRIHGKFWHIGAWTHRMSHSSPNQGNIYAPFHGVPKDPIEEIKERYDGTLRSLWDTSEGVLVGTDMDGAQLRILTTITKSEAWKQAITSGDKSLGTDVHSMNMKNIGPVCRNRDVSKTFCYAVLLGASIPKVADIFSCNIPQAKKAYENFLEGFPELKKLKKFKIPFDASRGYFVGIDGRKVQCNSEHLMLAGYLQNGEAVIMKHWTVEWRTLAKSAGLWFRHVDMVHDEVQVEVKTMEDAALLVKIQEQAMENINKKFNLFCPMAIEAKTGTNWLESH
jgi:DNA polymerase I